MSPRLARLLALVALIGTFALASCSRHVDAPHVSGPHRTFRMGFSAIPPKPDFDVLLANLDLWTRRADAAIIHIELPWDSLLAGRRPDSLVVHDPLPLAQYYRGKGLDLVVTIDPGNGLDRSGESAPLVAAGRSLTEPAIQQLYRAYVTAIDTLLHPDYLGLAAETNLIRAAAPPSLYAAVVQVANAGAADIRSHDSRVQLYVSVQVDVARGALAGSGTYVGIAQDLSDFPFIQALGLSSYPYLAGFAEPDSVPIDYYSRIAAGTALPVMVVEGGWASTSLGSFVSSPEKQARWIRRHLQLLDRAKAIAVFQLTFADLDLTAITLPPGSILPLFASIGLADVNLVPKPSLVAWDSAFAIPRR